MNYRDPYIQVYESQGDGRVFLCIELFVIPVSTEPALPFPHDRVLYERLSRLIAVMVVRVQQKDPSYLQLKFRTVDLAEKQERLAAKLIGLLSPHDDFESLKRVLEGALQQILLPHFFETAMYQSVLQQVAQHFAASLPSEAPPLQGAEESAIALLLLDAENLNLPESAEAWIAECCQSSFQIKIAFGNWRKLGKRDQELHARGYQMIHVPPGKNEADLKMTALGAAMPGLAPRVKEVVICSSDRDLDHLKQALSSQGLKVYQVRRQDNALTLVNGKPQAPKVFPLTPPSKTPSLAEGLQFLKTQIASAPEQPIPFNQIGLAFYQHFKISLRQFINHHGFDQTPKAFLESQPDFLLATNEANQVLHICLKTQSTLVQPQSEKQDPKSFTPRTLEIVSKGILKRLIREQLTNKIRLELIAAQFRKQYGQPITAILQQHKLDKSLPKFFQSIEGITVEWDGRYWLISLTQPT